MSLKSVFEDSVCGYESHRHICIYEVSANRFFYREYASDCGREWFNCGFIDTEEAIDVVEEFATQSWITG